MTTHEEEPEGPVVKNMTRFMVEAKKRGFYQPGWTIEDYLRSAPTKYRWECFPIWGIKGSYKSNRLMKWLYTIYGDWELVHKYMIMQPLEFTNLIKEEGRIPMIGWDDIGGWFDSQMYFENRGLYTQINRCWKLMRTKLNIFVATIPRKDELPGFILRDINAEVFCSPAMTYDYDRWTWRKSFKDPEKVVKKPINISLFEPFDIKEVPTREFMKYWKRRVELADTATSDMVSILEEAFSDVPEALDEVELDQRILKKSSQITASRNPENRAQRIRELKTLLESAPNAER